MQQHDIPELTPDEELDRTRVLPDPVDPLEGSARLPELRPEDEPGPEDEPEVPQKPKRRGLVVRKIVKYFLFLVLAVAIVAAGGIGYLTVTEYRPAYAEDAQRGNVLRESKLTGGQTVRVLTLNTGYGGLDAGEDFFMDGGDGVRTVSHDGVLANLTGIEDELAALDPDFIFLQEVDQDSERTYGINERARLAAAFAPEYASAYALNFDVAYVPYPLPPIGAVESGIMTLSRMQPTSAERVQLPCPFSWPVRLGNLKRCLLVERIPLTDSETELVLVNLHLEAYDDGEGKAAQTAQLAQLLQEERAKGNYVIAGGDFNQSFSNVDTSMYPLQGDDLWQCGYIDVSSLGNGFTAAMDNTTPTCRSLDRPYDESNNFQFYMIDGFIVSDNIRIDALETIDAGFEFTDHNPVLLNATLL